MLGVYGIYDVKAHSFSVPFFSVSDGVAKRDFSDLVCDKRSSVSRHPSDYRLHRLGSFDEQTGTLIANELKEVLCTGDEFAEHGVEQLKLFPSETDVSLSVPASGRSL